MGAQTAVQFLAWTVSLFLVCYSYLTPGVHGGNMSITESFNSSDDTTDMTGPATTGNPSTGKGFLRLFHSSLKLGRETTAAVYNNNGSDVDKDNGSDHSMLDYVENNSTVSVTATNAVVFTNAETLTLDISSFGKPVIFDVYQEAPTEVQFKTSESQDDLEVTLNTSGTVKDVVNNVKLVYSIQEEENDTMIQLSIVQTLDRPAGQQHLKTWQIVVPVVLCGLCCLVLALCLVKYAKRRRSLYQMRPTHPMLDPPPNSKHSETVITKRVITAPSYLGNFEGAHPLEPYDRSAYIIRTRPPAPSYRMEGDLERISEERESAMEFSSSDDIDGASSVASDKPAPSPTPTKTFLDLIAEKLPFIDCSDGEESIDDRFFPPVNSGSLYDSPPDCRNYPMDQSTFKAGDEAPVAQSTFKRGGGGLIPVTGSRPFTLTVMLTVTVVTALAAVYAFSYGDTQSTLTITLPSSIPIRKVRSYSKDPTLDIVSLHETANLRTSVQMYDIEECSRDGTACRALAACDNFIGSYKCRCRTGFYVQGAKCQACSTTCNENHYMTQPCTVNQDVVCKPCTVCNGSTYEAASCSTTQDRVCIDVTYPVKGFKENVTVTHNEEGTVTTSASSNVFIEKLSSVNDLQTTFYATNNQQSYDLKNWKRDSGLEITLSIRGLYLIPEYRDVDHVSDNIFIEKGFRSTQADRAALKQITKYYCRNPVPDRYNLGLTIIPDRTTSASVVTCGSPNTTINCPAGYPDGKQYLHRSLNDHCPKAKNQALPELNQLPNSIACTDDVSLLHEVFRIPNLKPEPKSYPSSQCATAQRTCDLCVKQTSCSNTTKPNGDNCCHLACYNNRECHLGFSPLCPPPPVECATGNAYIYTLEPTFRSLPKRFQCHLTYMRKPYLYQVGYTVRLPGLNIDLPDGLEEVTSDDRNFRSSGKVEVGFITLKHDIGMQIHDEVILTGKYAKNDEKNFVIYPLKEESELRHDPFRVDQPHESSYLTSVQFARPFEFSSATWWANGCSKNISKLYPAQRLYRDEPINVTGQVGWAGAKVRYQTLPQNHIPSIRITIPGNRSVLSSYQREMMEAVLDTRTLTAKLTGDWNKAMWILQVQGHLKSCPGILSMEVYDKCAGTKLGHYDILVDCPTNFNIVLDVAQQNLTFTPAVFSLILKDANSTYRMYLSAFQKPFYLPIEEEDKFGSSDLDLESPWKPMMAMAAIALLALIFCGIVYACVSHSRKDNVYIAGQGDRSPTYLSSKELERLNQGEGFIRNSSPRRNLPASKTLLVIFSFLYILYSIFFTLSVFFGVLYFSYSDAVSNIENITAVKIRLKENFTTQLESLSAYEQREINRLSNLVVQRQKACGYHLEREVEEIYQGLGKSLQSQLESVGNRTMKLENALLTYMFDKATSYDNSLDAFLSVYNASLQDKLDVIYVNYKDYLVKVPMNGWLTFAKQLYESLHGKKRPVSASNEKSLIKFLSWLGVDKVRDVLTAKQSLDKQLTSSIPRLRRILFSNPNTGKFMEHDSRATTEFEKEETFVMKFITVETEYSSKSDQEADSTSMDEEFYKGNNPVLSDELASSVLPVILIALVVCDICLLVHRVVRLCKLLQQLIWGVKEFIPLDHVSGKIYEISKGRTPPRMYDPLEHPYNYLKDNREDILSPGGEMYFFPQNMPKAKEDLLRDIWNHKKKQKPQTEPAAVRECCMCGMWQTVCRVVTSKVTWKFIVILALMWMVCVLVKLVDSLVTMEMFQYLLSVDILLPQLRMHYNTTNANLENYAKFYNIYLRDYNTWMDSEALRLNAALQTLKSSQERALVQLMNRACSVLVNTTAAKTVCDLSVPLFPIAMTIPSCNFLPMSAEPYIGMQFGRFVSQVNEELSPLVDSVRTCLFSAAYLLVGYLCLLVVLYTAVAAIVKSLRHKGLIPNLGVFQTANVSSAQWPERFAGGSKDMYPSGSWAQSESGVYVEGEEPHRAESHV